jgi:F-type H+-transporting ATPase subunit delta
MTSHAAAGRYARALFDVVLKESKESKEPKERLEQVQNELQALADVVKQSAPLAAVFGNPAVPAAKKHAIAQAVLQKAGIGGPLAKLVLLLADRDRLMLLPDLATVYRERVQDYQGIVRGEVISAAPLAPEKVRGLEEALKRATGRTVILQTRVDAGIIGGVVTRIGSTVYDGSVTTQLQKLKQTLIEAAQ